MKSEKVKRLVLLTIVFVMLISTSAFASSFTVSNGITENGETLLPLRYIAEKAGYAVDWSNEQRAVILKKGNNTLTVKINDEKATINDRPVTLKSKPIIIDSKTHVSIDFFSMLNDQYITKTTDNSFAFTQRNIANPANMIDTITEISKKPRSSDDITHEQAQQYVIDKFKKYGYEVQIQDFDFEYFDWSTLKSSPKKGKNIIATKMPNTNSNTTDILILGAHYDGVKGVPAANDNGSGLSVLLELARILKDLPSDTQIRFIAFDAEEAGLCGSKAYVKALGKDAENIIGMLNFDMLAGAKAKKWGVHSGNGKENFLFDILKQNYEFSDTILKPHPGGGSDHMSFSGNVISSLDFSHETIKGEYHCANDIVENISPDMLKLAAENGYAIASTIMSNLTPSYKEISKPKNNNTIYEISPQTRIPTYGNMDAIERKLNVRFTQIPSDNNRGKYEIMIRLFGFEKPLELIYEAQPGSNYISISKIDLIKSGVTFNEIKNLLDNTLKNCIEWEYNNKHDYNKYFYNNIYGNTYIIEVNKKNQTLKLFIDNYGIYIDDNNEAYKLDGNKLIHMSDANLEENYTFLKKNDKIEITKTETQPDNRKLSEIAQKCWDKIEPLFTDKELKDISYVVFKTNGLGVGKSMYISSYDDSKETDAGLDNTDFSYIDGYKEMSKSLQAAIFHANKDLVEGETTQDTEGIAGKRLFIDYLDLTNKLGNSYSNYDLIKNFTAMYFQDIFDDSSQKIKDAKYPENGTNFENSTFRYVKDGYIYKFAEKFYKDLFNIDDYSQLDLYAKYQNDFVCEEATANITADMAYSFGEFVVSEKPIGNSVKEQKIRFFYDYPEFMKLRERFRLQMN